MKLTKFTNNIKKIISRNFSAIPQAILIGEPLLEIKLNQNPKMERKILTSNQ